MRLCVFVLLTSSIASTFSAASAQQPAAAAGPVSTAPASPSSAVDSSYIVAPSDELTVTVWQEPALSGERLVRPDGKISMSLLGDVQAAGLKPMDLANEIAHRLQKYVKDPLVSVVVYQIHHNSVYLLGEVGKKGSVELTQGMTLLEAIASAGGLTDYAKKSKIYILRAVNGRQQKLLVNYKKALRGDAASNVALEPGDTIVVP